MTCYCLPDSLLRDLIKSADDAERIAHALEGVARFADETQRGEIGDNLAILSDALRTAAATVEAVAVECRKSPVVDVVGGVDA